MRREAIALCLAVRHPATPWYAKALAAAVVAYAVSPIDLIPDPIPVLGYLDDLVILPLGVLLVRWTIPDAVLEDCRRAAAHRVAIAAPWRRTGTVLVVLCWMLGLGLVAWLTARWLR